MRVIHPISSIELLSLLTSKICHDLVSPIGAINNGIELLEENSFTQDAIHLIKIGAENASSKLQLMRIAFGATKGLENTIHTNNVKDIAVSFFANEKLTFSWEGADCMLPKIYMQLLLNVLLVAKASLIKGGKISISIKGNEQNPEFFIQCEAKTIKIPELFWEMYKTGQCKETIDTRNIQIYYTFLIAEEASMEIEAEATSETIEFRLKKIL